MRDCSLRTSRCRSLQRRVRRRVYGDNRASGRAGPTRSCRYSTGPLREFAFVDVACVLHVCVYGTATAAHGTAAAGGARRASADTPPESKAFDGGVPGKLRLSAGHVEPNLDPCHLDMVSERFMPGFPHSGVALTR